LRNVLVTGASRGLGLGIARTLAGSGFQVIAVARGETDLIKQAITQVTDSGLGALHFRPVDLADIAGLPGFVKAVRREFGPIHGLVNNAGLGTPGVLANMKDADIARLVHLNVLMPLTLTKHVVRSMLSAGAGCIVNISSVVSLTGYSGLSAYSATKASLLGFTRSLAREVGPLGITVNAVAPGFINTDMTQSLSDAQREAIKRRSALHRLTEIEDVANMVDYLFSEKARGITGTVMTVDAGNTA
jgi:3-oxoacyl-[acyl-carrier protein] reductase